MDRYIAVDPGKHATKVAIYDKEKNETKVFSFKTRFNDGDFEDDSLEKNTFICEVDGKVYKVGNAATTQAEQVTSKQTEIHKLCGLIGIALCCSDGEVDNVHVAVSIPVKEWEVVEKRNAYKAYMLPEGTQKIKVKTSSAGEIKEKSFNIVSRYAFPESQGALFLDNAEDNVESMAAIVDIGHLNINCTIWDNFELDRKASVTNELGGGILISGLSQMLSAEFSRCDEKYVEKLLLREDHNDRCLKPKNPDAYPDMEDRSRKLIKEYLLSHVRDIKACLDARKWSLDFMNLIFMGGTSMILEDEIREVFGSEVYIPEHAEFANALGFLRILCTKDIGRETWVPNPKAWDNKPKEKEKKIA